MTCKTLLLSTSLALVPLASQAETQRDLDAHVHGEGKLNIAVEGSEIALELEVPGFDIVGFEHSAESQNDKDAIAAALTALSEPLNVFQLPEAADCHVTKAVAELHNGEYDEDHEEHGHGDHEDHHDHEDSHDHADHENAQHSEFHAEYVLSCQNTAAIDVISLGYFSAFKNAKELHVQFIDETGAKLLEASADQPELKLR
ncbi:hypothetical protein TRP8649_02504 [Pelagimonas phthalicica]|uniref:DUF2796 domain-containing protein n=1 Tax=Pelagimonas phthalicica TaxID=1037362 RepID=A0A238JDW9_9RHOB|nr:DUF2796 domain-containing protein [Pelagimonas phthalicica]TDS91335.1 uncharacterized protein DUF2796 [Pelagimonas phthalicica]SMX28384.1 hypothetical protein TRP8649_02504 [Pelagimonas phthalicica]